MFKHRVRSYRGNFDLQRHTSSNDIFCFVHGVAELLHNLFDETSYQYNAPV